MTFAKRTKSLKKSATQEINDRAKELIRKGEDVIDLGAGDPSFREPKSSRLAGIKAIEEGFTGYTEAGGIPSLREAIKARYEKVFGVELAGREAMATVGAKSGLFVVSQLLLEEGDEIVMPRPYWVSYPAQAKLAGARPVFAAGDKENHHLPTAAQIEEVLGPDTAAVLINSPANPSGGVYEPAQGKELVELAGKYDLFLISDECYDGFTYQQDRFWTLASSRYQKGIVVGSTSKNFAMTGWRLGYLLGDQKVIETLEKLQSQITSSPPAISQKAAEAAFCDDLSLDRKVRDKFREKRDLFADKLNELPGLECPTPPGSFYLFPEIKNLLVEIGFGEEEDEEFARLLLDKTGVVTVPGTAFGKSGFLRMAYLPSIERLMEAADRIRSTLQEL